MRGVYEKVGGHPYTLNLLARHAQRSSVEQALAGVSGLSGELLDFTLLEQAAGQLTERARLLLRRAAVYEQPVPVEGLAYLLGDDKDVMPDVRSEVTALEAWGLLSRLPGEEDYTLPVLAQDWARRQWADGEERTLLKRAGEYWRIVGRESSGLEPELIARQYFFQAGMYEEADNLVQFAFHYLLRWGQIELALRLLQESAATLTGKSKAVALGNSASIYQKLGNVRPGAPDVSRSPGRIRESGGPA